MRVETATAVTHGAWPRSATDPGGGDLADVAVLRALASPVRLGILRQLAVRPETCACDFTELFALRQPTISQHLRVLREAGLVRTHRRGTQICYSVEPAPLARLERLLAGLRAEPPG
jgi:ArsR family transcriptional regulator